MGGIEIGPGEHARKDFALRLDRGRSIGVSRACWEKVITPGWEVEGRCRASKGVGPPLWSDPKQEGSRAHSIGRAERFPRSASESCSPGPGAYKMNQRKYCEPVVKPRNEMLHSDTRKTMGNQP